MIPDLDKKNFLRSSKKMGKLEEAKTFGGIGAILSLGGLLVPYGGIVIAIVGLALVFIAVKNISETINQEEVFRNYLIYFVLTIVSFVAVTAIIVITFISAGGFSFISTLHSMRITGFSSFWRYFGRFIGGFLVSLLVGWMLTIFSAVYLKRSYNEIADHTGVYYFKTTATLYFIGAALLIILVGALIIFIAKIVEIIAFFSLPEKHLTAHIQT